MAKGSVRKKGKKWYYRFYVENESGNLVQKEYAGTESKSETEKLLRKAMEDYEEKKFVAKTENITLGEMLDIWLEEEVTWKIPTHILYGEKDNLTAYGTIFEFAQRTNSTLSIMKNGEHWFHTEEQMKFLDEWINKSAQ